MPVLYLLVECGDECGSQTRMIFIHFLKCFIAVFCKNRSFSVKIIEYKKMFGIINQYAC